jgi:hypothetical protein
MDVPQAVILSPMPHISTALICEIRQAPNAIKIITTTGNSFGKIAMASFLGKVGIAHDFH